MTQAESDQSALGPDGQLLDTSKITKIPAPLSSPFISIQSAPIAAGSPQKSFTARYHRKEKPSVNELEEYFKLPAEDFDAYNPIRWWIGHRAQFPNLFCMARDILCISGELSVSYRLLFQTYLQAPLSPLRGYSQVVVTQSPSDALVSKPTQSVYLFLSRSAFILTVKNKSLDCDSFSAPVLFPLLFQPLFLLVLILTSMPV
jgi:hypothetical protein